MPCSFTGTSALINHAAEFSKELRYALHFIHDHERVVLRVEKGPWSAQQGTICFIFEINIECRCPAIVGNGARQVCLADLTRSLQDYPRHMVEAFADKLVETAGYHASKIGKALLWSSKLIIKSLI
jgi:hypothetical protein